MAGPLIVTNRRVECNWRHASSVVITIRAEVCSQQVSQYSQLTFKGKFSKIQKTKREYLVFWWARNVWRPHWQIYILTPGGWESSFCSDYFAHFPKCSCSWQLCLSPGCLGWWETPSPSWIVTLFHNNIGMNTNIQFSQRSNVFQHVESLPTLWNNKVISKSILTAAASQYAVVLLLSNF